MRLLASILITNYNYGQFLDQCLSSIAGQTYDHTEVILVDDGSTDDSLTVISRWTSRLNLTVIAQPNVGQASALNVAFNASKGDLIFLLDADDAYESEKVGEVVEYFQGNASVALIQHDMYEVDVNGKRLGSTFGRNSTATGCRLLQGDLRGHILNAQDPFSWYFAPSSGLVMPRSVARRVFPLPTEFKVCADVPIAYGAAFIGSIGLITKPLGSYRLHTLSSYASLKSRDARAWASEQFMNKLERYSLTLSIVEASGENSEKTIPNVTNYPEIWEFYYTYLYPNKFFALLKIFGRRYTDYKSDIEARVLVSPLHFLMRLILDIQSVFIVTKRKDSDYFYRSLGRLSARTKILLGDSF